MSNPSPGRDAVDPAAPAPARGSVRPATPGEIEPALRLILGAGGRRAADEQVVEFLAFAMQRGIDLRATWVAEIDGRIVWAVLPVVSPGRTVLMFAPPHAPAHGLVADVGPSLIDAATAHHGRGGATLAQALIDPHERAAVRLFERCGFARLAELIYLHRAVSGAPRWPAWPDSVALETYSAATHARFARAVTASYDGSLDCPALNGLRDVEDVLAGHKAAGDFDPSLWFLLRERRRATAPAAGAIEGADGDSADVPSPGADGADDSDGAPLGVLLLSRAPRSDALELVYLGLTPAARGRGLGDLAMRHALAAVAHDGAARLSLAVDALNAPALRLYYRHGLKRLCSRLALIRDLRPPA